MPEMDGLELIIHVRESGLKIPIIVLSSTKEEYLKTACLHAGANLFLNRDPTRNDLLDRIDEVLESKQDYINDRYT